MVNLYKPVVPDDPVRYYYDTTTAQRSASPYDQQNV